MNYDDKADAEEREYRADLAHILAQIPPDDPSYEESVSSTLSSVDRLTTAAKREVLNGLLNWLASTYLGKMNNYREEFEREITRRLEELSVATRPTNDAKPNTE